MGQLVFGGILIIVGAVLLLYFLSSSGNANGFIPLFGIIAFIGLIIGLAVISEKK